VKKINLLFFVRFLELVGDGFLKPIFQVRMRNSRKMAGYTELHLNVVFDRRSRLFQWTMGPVMAAFSTHQFRHALFQLKLSKDYV
jgi:hypothetical protein